MPPKTIRCCVCGQDVLKSQTYATGEKDDEGNPLRACKEHEGIIEKAEELKEKAAKEIKNTCPAIDKVMQRGAYFRSKTSAQREKDKDMLLDMKASILEKPKDVVWMNTHCWCCGDEGVSLHDFFQLRLVAMEKMKIEGKAWNPFVYEESDIKEVKKMLGGRCIIIQFSLDDEMYKRYLEWEARIHPKCRPMVQIGKVIRMCHGCQEKTGIKADLEKMFPLPELKVLSAIGAVFQDSPMQQEIHEVAQELVDIEEIQRTKRN